MYFGTGDEIPGELDEAKRAARADRMEVNRAQSCAVCDPLLD